jgi:hypothetical protein
MGLSLFEIGAGSHQLRIQPNLAEAADGDWLFCLGSDLEFPPVEGFEIGDSVNISASMDLSANPDFVRIQARFRQPANMPIRETLPGTPTVTQYNRGGSPPVSVIDLATNFFDGAKHQQRSIRLEGTGINDGTYKIAFVVSPTQATLADNSILGGPGGPVNIDTAAYMLGAHWSFIIDHDNSLTPLYSTEVLGGVAGLSSSKGFGLDGGRERDYLMVNAAVVVKNLPNPSDLIFKLQLLETP